MCVELIAIALSLPLSHSLGYNNQKCLKVLRVQYKVLFPHNISQVSGHQTSSVNKTISSVEESAFDLSCGKLANDKEVPFYFQEVRTN